MVTGWFKRGISEPQAKAAVPVRWTEAQVGELLRAVEDNLRQGRFEAVVSQLEPATVANPDNPKLATKLGIALYSLGRDQEARNVLTRVIGMERTNALAQHFLLATLHRLGDDEAVLAAAAAALAVNPHQAALLSMIGTAHLRFGGFEQAAQFFNQGLAADPESLPCLEGLELLSQKSTWHRSYYQHEKRIEEARVRQINRLRASHRRQGLDAARLTSLLNLLQGDRSTFEKALELATDLIDHQDMSMHLALVLASIFSIAGDSQNMLKLREKAYDLAPQDPGTRLALSDAWLFEGGAHWMDAWPMMTTALSEITPYLHLSQVPLWEGQRRRNPKVLVYQNRGMADTLMGLRLAPLLAPHGIRFAVWTLPELADLAARIVGPENVVRSVGPPDPREYDCTYAVPFFGIIPALGLSAAELKNCVPVQTDKTHFATWRERIRQLPGKRVGLVSAGNPLRREDWMRSLPPDHLDRLARLRGLSWVNLNFDQRPEREASIRKLSMTDPMVDVKSFLDTAAIIDELDGVVAIDCSTAHLSALLGKPTWVLAPPLADWRWQMGGDAQAWWPTATVYRSDAPGQWTSAFEQLAPDLARFALT